MTETKMLYETITTDILHGLHQDYPQNLSAAVKTLYIVSNYITDMNALCTYVCFQCIPALLQPLTTNMHVVIIDNGIHKIQYYL